jgi:hypothetical protein
MFKRLASRNHGVARRTSRWARGDFKMGHQRNQDAPRFFKMVRHRIQVVLSSEIKMNCRKGQRPGIHAALAPRENLDSLIQKERERIDSYLSARM